jgi:hypothetical protein
VTEIRSLRVPINEKQSGVTPLLLVVRDVPTKFYNRRKKVQNRLSRFAQLYSLLVAGVGGDQCRAGLQNLSN